MTNYNIVTAETKGMPKRLEISRVKIPDEVIEKLRLCSIF